MSPKFDADGNLIAGPIPPARGAKKGPKKTRGAERIALSISASAPSIRAEDTNPAGADEWPELVPLSRRENLPPFPLEALPAPLGAWVEHESIFTQTPPEMAAAFALASVSALAAGHVWVEAREGWIEGTNLWLAVVAEPGTRKSPVHSDATAPIREIQAERAEKARPKIARRCAEIELKEDEVKRLRSAVSKMKGAAEREAATRDYLEAVEAHAALVPMAEPRIIAGDVTPERLVEMLGEQGGALALMSDEDTVIGHLLGRYSRAPSIESFLSAYSNRAIDRDRRSSKSVRVERPALTVATCLQPGLLEKAGADDLMVGRGLLDRFAFVCPPNLVGRRDMNPPPVPRHIREGYRAALLEIGAELAEADFTITLDDDAAAWRNDWLQALERKRGASGAYAGVVGFASKLDGLVARLAGVLHVVECRGAVEGTFIRRETVEAAAAICECFAEHAAAAYDLIGVDEPMRDARSLLAWAMDHGKPFNVRDVIRSRGPKWGELFEAAIAVLVTHGYVRLEKKPPGPKGGRPASAFHLRPDLPERGFRRFCRAVTGGTKGERIDPSLLSLADPGDRDLRQPAPDKTDKTSRSTAGESRKAHETPTPSTDHPAPRGAAPESDRTSGPSDRTSDDNDFADPHAAGCSCPACRAAARDRARRAS